MHVSVTAKRPRGLQTCSSLFRIIFAKRISVEMAKKKRKYLCTFSRDPARQGSVGMPRKSRQFQNIESIVSLKIELLYTWSHLLHPKCRLLANVRLGLKLRAELGRQYSLDLICQPNQLALNQSYP